MDGNGSKTNRKQSKTDDRPWWHSGSHCLAALFWVFTLSVAWYGILNEQGMTWTVIAMMGFGLILAVIQASMASVLGGKSR